MVDGPTNLSILPSMAAPLVLDGLPTIATLLVGTIVDSLEIMLPLLQFSVIFLSWTLVLVVIRLVSLAAGGLRLTMVNIWLVVLVFLVVVRKRRLITCRGRHILGVRTSMASLVTNATPFLIR